VTSQEAGRASSIRVGPVDVAYDHTVLEPRPWTFAQAEWAAELAQRLPDGPILELCTGAGHIGLAAALLTGRHAVLVDASEHACRFARLNAAGAGISERVEVRHGDLAGVLRADEQFPLVVADPPYIPSDEVGRFPEDPLTAIDGGHDGLRLARMCLEVATYHVTRGGVVVLQLRDQQQVGELVGPTGSPGGPGSAPRLRLREVRTVPDRGVLAQFSPLD
jgi:release factor glutamine methyltransferase